MDINTELWAAVPSFEGAYKISNYGRVGSLKHSAILRVLSNTNKTGDYLAVVLQYKELVRYTRIHRLVAECFIPNPCSYPEVNHIDGNKQNNFVNNLEWVTRSYNVRDAIKRNPNIIAGMNYYNTYTRPRKVQQSSLLGEVIAEYPNCVAAAISSGACARDIHAVAAKEEYRPGKTRKQAGGFVWKFIEEG